MKAYTLGGMADTMPGLNAALQQIWKKNLPQTRERLALLSRAAAELRTEGSISPELHTEAHATAHKLAGSLGMFGYSSATEHARAVERMLQAQQPADHAAIADHVDALRTAMQDALND